MKENDRRSGSSTPTETPSRDYYKNDVCIRCGLPPDKKRFPAVIAALRRTLPANEGKRIVDCDVRCDTRHREKTERFFQAAPLSSSMRNARSDRLRNSVYPDSPLCLPLSRSLSLLLGLSPLRLEERSLRGDKEEYEKRSARLNGKIQSSRNLS